MPAKKPSRNHGNDLSKSKPVPSISRHGLTAVSLGAKERRTIAEISLGAARYFRNFGRHFIWRDERNPYRLAVAEILLQKTRAQSATETYRKILELYPNVECLGKADRAELEELLRPIGLFKKRAMQLIAMAQAVACRGADVFGDWRELERDIPGLGAYAARAIACFGRGEKVGIVDANVARILRRVFRIRTTDSRAAIYQKYADAVAARSADPRETNFGLLDIGAAICVSIPKCPICPLLEFCAQYGVKRFQHPAE